MCARLKRWVVPAILLLILLASLALCTDRGGEEMDTSWYEETGPADGPVTIAVTGDSPPPPPEPVRLIFIHHSCGENWLADWNGGLAIALRDSNYAVSDTNYGWGPVADSEGTPIGDLTDIGHWWTWFRGLRSGEIMEQVYAESGQHSEYSRLEPPAGENEIIMFKSCFPNSALQGRPGDPVPSIADNPLKGEASWTEYHTVANAKGIYMDLRQYFQAHPDKFFVVVTAPPVSDPTYAANARALNTWLVDDWLDGYPYRNVMVFDFYNVLTSNGGNREVSDVNRDTGNHHRWWNGAVQHTVQVRRDTSAYASARDDDHPTAAGNQKATAEFVPLLNHYYGEWKGG